MKEIYFIRHGESRANAGFATHSPETIALTEKGFEQSQYIPNIFTETPELIVTSPFLRTKQTAEMTIKQFAAAKVEEWNVQEFTYLSLTKYADTTTEFRRPFVEAYWDKSEAEFCDGDGSESFAAFISRAKGLIEKIVESKYSNIAVFSHGQFVKAVIWLLINEFPEINNASMKVFYNFLYSVFVPNASMFRLFVDATGKNVRLSGITTMHLPKELITF